MAKVKLNQALTELRGSIGDLVYIPQPDGSTIVRRKPTKLPERTKGQLKQQSRVAAASAYWRKIKDDPSKLAIYKALPRKRSMGLRQFAIRDFLRSPIVENIDVNEFGGKAGNKVRISATDDTAVVEVMVRVEDMQGSLIEEGSATLDVASGTWIYELRVEMKVGQTVTVRATAKDQPGNSIVKTALAYVR